ncbi:DUF6240 domain-containing protein [Butyrivibrio sp. YAB3001]|uniref:DUF6240 domain-containing protein n=1 Tax=Butyrivibrio sp. YAB3001 TaxID=1520812 RepID=UPI0008F64992|nr:DUF6240 domain-containing protein [Butyrivibrio sp. YAB3001]SFC83731.1 hypothetical protein SAMN02910398_03265 [Butyrivibrio sp. YAB3001]
MNISFQTITSRKHEESLNTLGTDSRYSREIAASSKQANVESVSIQLDSSFFSNEAYSDHTKTAEDIREMAENTDVMTQHNYMALLSNTMSKEDFAKAVEDGFDIKTINSAETVTILDKIKSVLLQAGTMVTGYNDDLSLEKLAKITGSMAFAKELSNDFHESDVPVTLENVKAAGIAFKEISEIDNLDDSAIKYMVTNEQRPTIENIYFAAHSTNGQNIAGKGYYAQDAGGYYAQKADSYNWEQLDEQISRIIDESGLDSKDDEVREEARWIVKQGIPLTPKSLKAAHEIKAIDFPISEELSAKAITAAIANGTKATNADLADPRSNYEKASDYKKAVEEISDNDIRTAIEGEKELNIRNLSEQTRLNIENPKLPLECEITEQEPRFIKARLQLEEIRLRMTTEANKQLLDSGFSIDTEPMEKLIETLKTILGQASDEAAGDAIDEITGVTPQNREYIISATISSVSIISNGPIGITGLMLDEMETAPLSQISDNSRKMVADYQRAGQEYETMMTRPRADLGDNIKDAFRNADELLKELNMEVTEDNKRAIRILGYNQMEIKKDNFEKVRAWDQMLKVTLERLKPGAVLDLIRNGKNPLGMTIDELAANLNENESNKDGRGSKRDSRGEEKYSRFLYKLEHKKEITEKEKQAFIGIYRLFSTIKANDYQAIGSVLKTGLEMTLGNLLQATRTQKTAKRGMDYTVDDAFGGISVENKEFGLKIDEQISSAFRYYSAQADIVYENLEPEKLMAAKPDESTLLPELARKLQEEEKDKELDEDYNANQVRYIRENIAAKDTDGAAEELRSLGIEVNFNNLEAMISNRRERRSGSIWDKAQQLSKKEISKEQSLLVDALGEDDYEEVYKDSLENISDKLSELLMNDDDTYIDVRAISLMQRRLSIMSQSSDKGSFDVPVEIDGEKITMHITLRSDDSMDSRMEASIQTYEFGLLTANLYEKNGIISGMLTTTNAQSSEESEYLESVRSKMCVNLAEKLKDYGVAQDKIAILYHAQRQPISVGKTNANATDGSNKKTTDTKVLLTMAKAFIEAL